MPHASIWFQRMAHSCQQKWNKNVKIGDNCELNLWIYSEQMQHRKLQMLLIIPSINSSVQDQIIPTTQINNSEMTSYVAYNKIQICFLRVYMLSWTQHWMLSIYADKVSIIIPCFSDPSHICLGFFTAALSRCALPVPCRDRQTAGFLGYSCVLELYGDSITKENISALP